MNKDFGSFLKKFNKTKKQFQKTGYAWDDLMKIADDYDKYRKELLPIIEFVAKKLHHLPDAHSVRYRVKKTDHLIEKIIRRKLSDNKSRKLTVNNYKKYIYDFAGMRILHIYKEQWQLIHEFIIANFNINMASEPTAFIDYDEDSSQYEKAKIKIFPGRDIGYRSIHYLITMSNKDNKNKKYNIEIQVRTIFEEGWSEIDHDIRYPYELDNELLKRSMKAFNILARTADEMGSFVSFLRADADFNKKRRIELSTIKEIDLENKKIIKQLERRVSLIEKTNPKVARSLMADISDLAENQENKADLMFSPFLSKLIYSSFSRKKNNRKK